jgi:hypothetical protein
MVSSDISTPDSVAVSTMYLGLTEHGVHLFTHAYFSVNGLNLRHISRVEPGHGFGPYDLGAAANLRGVGHVQGQRRDALIEWATGSRIPA